MRPPGRDKQKVVRRRIFFHDRTESNFMSPCRRPSFNVVLRPTRRGTSSCYFPEEIWFSQLRRCVWTQLDSFVHQLQSTREAPTDARKVTYWFRERFFPERIPLCYFLETDSWLDQPYM